MSKILPIVEHSLKYNKPLDGLRGVAILLVFLFHLYPKLFSFGYVGVDIFFVLSGYLITKIIYTKLDKKSFSFIEFYRNRIRRIFPTMIIVVFASFILGYIFLFPHEFLELIKHLKSSLYFYQNFRLIDEVGYWDQAVQLKPMLHFWSLSVEEQFYVLWPLIICIFYYLRINIFKGLLILSILLLVIPQFMEINKFYHSFSRFWELSFGGLIFSVELLNKYKINIKKLSKYSIYLFFISLFFSYGNEEYSIFKTAFVVLSTGLLILSLKFKGIHIKFLTSTILVFLGLISYPLYLWHYVIISYLHILKFNVVQISPIIISLSVFLSYITYRYVEFYARKQNNYKFAFLLMLLVLVSGLSLQYLRISKNIVKRSHLVINKNFEKQFEKPAFKNKQGISLVKSILGKTPKSIYILGTDDNINKKYIAIIGDSHAYAAYYGFSKIFKEKGYETILLANSACPAYIEGAIGTNRKNIEKCKNRIEETYTFINNAKYIKK